MNPVVFVVDDDFGVRNSLRWLVESEGFEVEAYGTAEEFLGAYHPGRPGCLVLDVKMPGMSGLDLQELLHERRIALPVIIISGHADVPAAVRAFKLGAVDLLQKPFRDEELLTRIHAAIQRDRQARRRAQVRAERVARLDLLTPRERQVMELVVSGASNKEVAAKLGLSLKTVEVHRARVMEKTQVGSLAELVRVALGAESDEDDDPEE